MECCILLDITPDGLEEENINHPISCNLYVSFKHK